MASALYILDLKGKVLISRDYRGDTPFNVIDKFVKRITTTEEEEGANIEPVFEDSGYSFAHILHKSIRCA